MRRIFTSFPGGEPIRQNKSFADAAPVWAVCSVIIIWLAVFGAGAYEDGTNLMDFMEHFSTALQHPFTLRWTPYTVKFILGFLALYVCAIGYCYSTRQNRRPGEEHGSAQWGSARSENIAMRMAR